MNCCGSGTFRAALFDLDGVLVDSAKIIDDELREWAVGHDLDPDELVMAARGLTEEEMVRTFAPTLDVGLEVARIRAREVVSAAGVSAMPGALELVAELVAACVPWAVVTNGSFPVVETRIRAAGFPRPHTLITSNDVTRGKPDPAGYLLAAEKIGFEPRACVAVEDTPTGAAAARAAGAYVVGVVGTVTAGELPADLLVTSLEHLRAADLVGGLAGDSRSPR
jgi:mannitol-1-/sugar-/sorbitol-6-phosphatase